MNTVTDEIISTEKACQLLGISRQTLYKLCDKGEIPGKKIGSQYKFVKDAVLDYLYQKEDGVEVKQLRGDFATAGIKKMTKRTFQELSSNIEELIVNAYDADATLVQIILDHDKSTLNIIDDGQGMDEKDLANFLIYGISDKTANSQSPKFKRSPIGEYGMGGKLAITNISRICKIITRKDGKEHVFNMNRAELDKAKYVSQIQSKVFIKKCSPEIHGTAVYMEQLSVKNIDSERLIERFSSKMPKSQTFKIIMTDIRNGDKREVEIQEPVFEYARKFDFEDDLKMIGKVRLTIYFTKEPIPATKQGIWTRVNGRIVNEKAEWFDLFRQTSGTRYRYRLYGYGEADGLKDFVTFSKNDFVGSPEFKEYWDFGNECIKEVQKELLKADEDKQREQDRDVVKNVEKEVNDVVSQLDTPDILGNLEAKIKKELTKEIESAPENPYPDIDNVEEEVNKIASVVKRGKDKRERRNQSLSKSEKMTYSGKGYTITTVDLSGTGDLVTFTREKSLIEINERHHFYIKSSKNGYLDNLVRDIAFAQIANDYSEGNWISFNRIFNELVRIASQKAV